MLRFRWAVQADYFAWRVTANDLTGITGPEENEKGLEDARGPRLAAGLDVCLSWEVYCVICKGRIRRHCCRCCARGCRLIF